MLSSWWSSPRSSTIPLVALADFLVIYRNIFEAGEVPLAAGDDAAAAAAVAAAAAAADPSSMVWTAENVDDVHLESDAEAIEYLARHDFNVDEATFNLCAEMGFSKGAHQIVESACCALPTCYARPLNVSLFVPESVHSHRALDLVARYSHGTLFHEAKDKLLSVSAPMVGAYHTVKEKLPTQLQGGVPSLMGLAAAVSAEAASAFTSIAGEGEGSDEPSGTLVVDITGEGSSTSGMPQSGPSSARLRGTLEKHQQDKGAKARWGVLYEKACTLLQRTAAAASFTAQSGSHGAVATHGYLQSAKVSKGKGREGGGGSSNQSDLAEAQEILDEACALPPIVNAPGESFAETMRTTLGELLAVHQDARAWEAEVRDALFPSEALLAMARANDEHPHTRIGATVAPPMHAVVSWLTMKDFRKLVREGMALRLRTDTEIRLKQSIARLNGLFKKVHFILTRGNIQDAMLGVSAGARGSGSHQSGERNRGGDTKNDGRIAAGGRGTHLTVVPGSPHGAHAGSRSGSSLLHSPSTSSQRAGGAAANTSMPITGRARSNSKSKARVVSEEVASALSDDDLDDDEGGGALVHLGTGKPALADISDVFLAIDRFPPGLVVARDRAEVLVGTDSSTYAFVASSPAAAAESHLTPLEVLKRLYDVSCALKASTEELLDQSAIAQTLKVKLCATGSAEAVAAAEAAALAAIAAAAPPPRFSSSSWYKSLSQPLSSARALVDSLLSHGVRIPRASEVDALVSSAEAWQKEVQALAPGASAASSSSEATKPASLRRVEILYAEGEKFPFELGPELDILREKRAQAKVWLDKLKKTMSMPKGGRRSVSQRSISAQGAGGGTESVADVDRPNLADIKLMVTESEDEQGADDDLGGTGGRGFVSNRELSKVQSVVEIAEEWLSRVREALSQSASMRVQRRKPKPASTVDEGAGKSDKVMDVAADDDNDDDDEDADPLEDLRELLKESDEMPVFMEEAGMLRCQLQALEWANKAALILPTNATVVVVEGENEPDEASLDNANDGGKGDSSDPDTTAASKSVSSLRPRLVEVQRLAKEIKRIRGNQAGNSGGSSNDWERGMSLVLPEETICVQIVTDAESLLAKLKKITQGTTISKGVPLEYLKELLNEGRRIPINLDYEMRPLKSAIDAADEWLQQNATALRVLGVSGERESTADKMAYEDVFTCVNAAAGISATFPEVEAARDTLRLADAWLAAVNERCQPQNRRGGKVGGVNNSSGASAAAPAAGSTRRKALHERIKSEHDERNGDADASETADDSVVAMSQSWRDCKSTPDALHALLAAGRSLRVDVAVEIEMIESTLAAINLWDKGAMPSLLNLDAVYIAPVVDRYRAIAGSHSEYSMKPLLPCLPFPSFVLSPPDTVSPKLRDDEAAQWMKIVDFFVEVQKMQKEARDLGVGPVLSELSRGGSTDELPSISTSFLTMELSATALQWVHGVRKLLLFPADFHHDPRLVSQTGVAASSKAKAGARGDHVSDSSGGRNGGFHWGDCPVDLIQHFICDAEAYFESATVARAAQLQTAYEGSALACLPPDDVAASPASAGDDDDSAAVAEKRRKIDCDDFESGAPDGHSGDGEGVDDEQGDEGEETGADTDGATGRRKRPRAEDADIGVGSGDTGTEGEARAKRVRKAGRVEAADNFQQESPPKAPKRRSLKGEKESVEFGTTRGTRGAGGSQGREDPDPTGLKASLGAASSDGADGPIRALLAVAGSIGVSSLQLPPALEQLLDFWLRCLKQFLYRAADASAWATAAHDMLNRALRSAAGSTAKQNWEDAAEEHLKSARDMMLTSQKRVIVEEYLETVRAWSKVAQDILNSRRGPGNSDNASDDKKKVTHDVLKEFVRGGEQLPSDRPELGDLKQELKRAKSWLTRFNRTGLSSGSSAISSSAEVIALVAEAKELCIDVSAELESANAATRKYCLCRQPYHGHMIGCDDCDDWYHFQCIGMTQAQAEKADKFSCIRCTLRSSFRQAANTVAQVTNRWCAPIETARFQEARRSKASKKVSKEEKEVNKLISFMDALSVPAKSAGRPVGSGGLSSVDESGAVQMDVVQGDLGGSDGVGGLPDAARPLLPSSHDGVATAAGTGATPFAASHQGYSAAEDEVRKQQLDLTKVELRDAFERLARAKAEEAECQRQASLEDERREEATEWMLAMQGVLWPENAADCELGRPVITDLPSDTTIASIVSAQLAGSTSAKPVDVKQIGESELLINGSKRVHAFYAPIPVPGSVSIGIVPGGPMPGFTPSRFGYPPGSSPTAALVAAGNGAMRNKDLLPYGMRNALDAATMLGIAEIADVEAIIEAFRWMAWCFHCLHVLRIPPATHTLRNLLKCARPFKFADEKVLRTVNGILTRAWYVLKCCDDRWKESSFTHITTCPLQQLEIQGEKTASFTDSWQWSASDGCGEAVRACGGSGHSSCHELVEGLFTAVLG